MKIILLAKVYEGKTVKYIVYTVEKSEIATVEDKKLINMLNIDNQKPLNFKLLKSNKPGRVFPIKFKPSIIRDGIVVEENYTIIDIDIDKNIVKLIDYKGNITEIGIKEYVLYYRKQEINNERVINGRLYLSHYGDKYKQNEYFEIGQLESEDIKGQEGLQEGLADKTASPFQEVLFNMYPYDRITIKYADLLKLRYVIVKILDSNLSGDKRVAVCKIYKNNNRTNYICCIIDFDDTAEVCCIQVIGHSDIPEKRPPIDINTLCIEYAAWRRSTKFLRIGSV